MADQLTSVLEFLRQNGFHNTLNQLQAELNPKTPFSPANQPLNRTVPIKNKPMFPKSDGKASYKSPDSPQQRPKPRSLIQNLFSNSPNSNKSKPNNASGDYNKLNTIDLSKQIEHFELRDRSFGFSEDNPVDRTKRLADERDRGFDNDSDQHNFSFCESGSKTKSYNKDSYISGNREDTTASIRNVLTGCRNVFSDMDKRKGLDLESKRDGVAPIFRPLFTDSGRFISYCEIFDG